jgi:predicted HTH transcriptional regulator
MLQRLIFVSSVQKELQQERYEIRDYVHGDPLLNKHFTVFLFEDMPPEDRRPDEVYLEMVQKSDIYVGLFGSKYGKPNAGGVSPVEQEYLCAREHAKHRMILIKEMDASARDSRMNALILKAQNEVVRNEFSNITKLIESIYTGLVSYLEGQHIITTDPFDAAVHAEAAMDDIAPDKISWFLKRAREERNYPLSENTPPADALRHLDLIHDGHLKNSALLLFAKQPQKFFIQAETKCLHFHGTTVAKPIPSYQIFKGTVFDQVDAAVDFVLSKLNRSVMPQSNSPASAVGYEIPYMAIREAIVNAVAHREYTSNAAVQVMIFADRVEVWNPGSLPAGLVPESLRSAHSSIPKNLHLATPLYLTHYIEKAGTGTLDMIALCTKAELPEPDFKQNGGQFVVTLWRNWLTDEAIKELLLTDRQQEAVRYIKINKKIANADYQKLFSISKPTASRDLEDLVVKGVLQKIGVTGKGTYYVLRLKGLIKGSKGSSPKSQKIPGNNKGLTKGSGVSSQNGIHMGHSKSPKTQGVIKGSKGTLPKASSHKKKNSKQDVNKTNRTSRHGAMKPSKSRKLKRTVKAAKKAPKKQSKNK